MSVIEYEKFSRKLAYHSAPTLLGIKCASLISVGADEFELNYHINIFNQKASVKGLKSRILCKCKNRVLMLVYSEKLLSKRISDCNVSELLKKNGYPVNSSLDEHLDFLASRIKCCNDFPHEIGIFLDYPLEDVTGFIENKGENFKMCGFWKVYGSEEKAKRIFSNYKKCRNFLCGKLNDGVDIYKALKIS